MDALLMFCLHRYSVFEKKENYVPCGTFSHIPVNSKRYAATYIISLGLLMGLSKSIKHTEINFRRQPEMVHPVINSVGT